jgi:hypothetical protein
MKSFPKSILLASVLLAIAALPGAHLLAADASPTASPAVKKFPFHGKVQAVDVTAMTFTLAGATPRVFNVTATTKIKKNGQTATLSDAVVGDDVGGYTERTADGKLTALSVRFGPRPGAKSKAAASPAGSAAAAPSATPKSKHKKSKAAPSPSASPSAS